MTQFNTRSNHLKKNTREAIKTFDEFAAVSGAALNVPKSEAKLLGPERNVTHIANIEIKPTMKSLGLKVGTNLLINWQTPLEKFKKSLSTRGRIFTMRGLAMHVNTKSASKLWYVAQSVDMKPSLIKKINFWTFNFIFGGKAEKRGFQALSRETLRLPWGEGGIGVVDFKLKMQSFRIKTMVNVIVHFHSKLEREWSLNMHIARLWVGSELKKIYPDFLKGTNLAIGHDLRGEKSEYYKNAIEIT